MSYSGADMWQKESSGGKHETSYMGVLSYADSKKIGKHALRQAVPIEIQDGRQDGRRNT